MREPRFKVPLTSARRRAIREASDAVHDQLAHLVRLVDPHLDSGAVSVPGLATLNGAKRALKRYKETVG